MVIETVCWCTCTCVCVCQEAGCCESARYGGCGAATCLFNRGALVFAGAPLLNLVAWYLPG